MSERAHPLLTFLSEHLGYNVGAEEPVLGYDLFYVDLSSWKLRLPDRNPLIWARHTDLERTSPQAMAQSLQDVVRMKQWRPGSTILVLVDGNAEPIRRYLRGQLHYFVFIDEEQGEAICRSRRPTGALLDHVVGQVPLAALDPYEINAPVTGSRFFGRQYELRQILSRQDTNHAVLGIRRIGKTSLLREIEHLLQEKEPAPVVYMDCSDLESTDDYIREVVRKLSPKELPRLHLQRYAFFFPNFLERIHRALKRPLVFLLDEIDNLVVQQRGCWDLFRMLRASSNKGACQYIVAGFREALREQHLQDSPFYNFAREVRLDMFSRSEAEEMVVTPMENLRIRFRDRNQVVGRIYEETSGHPNLIQYYCSILLRRLDQSGTREIGPDSLIDVYQDEGFRGHLLASFLENTTNREKVVVYTLLESMPEEPCRSFSQQELDAALRQHGWLLPQDDIERACQVLMLAGIFHRRGSDYLFTSPVFTQVLRRTWNLPYLLRKMKEEGI